VFYKEKLHGIFTSISSSSTPFGTASNTPSDTLSNTKIVGELVVVILATCAGKISNMGFVHPCGLQLLSSSHIGLSCYA
jgi:hypothetical protein